jgi:hypothetical protein
MNNYYKMSYVSNLSDVFKQIRTSPHHCNIYINLDNTMELLNLTQTVYKNNPSLRTKLISRTKSYDFTKNGGEYFIGKIFEEFKNDSKKIYVITNFNSDLKNDNIKLIHSSEFENIVNKDQEYVLIVDTNENKAKALKNKKNVHVMILRII